MTAAYGETQVCWLRGDLVLWRKRGGACGEQKAKKMEVAGCVCILARHASLEDAGKYGAWVALSDLLLMNGTLPAGQWDVCAHTSHTLRHAPMSYVCNKQIYTRRCM